MITKEQLQAMSDFEVNKALAVLLGFKLSNWLNNNYGHYEVEGTSLISSVKNYCNNPLDIMPLQEQHHICVVGDAGDWCAFLFENEEMEYGDKKLCRAIACCLILVLQEKAQNVIN